MGQNSKRGKPERVVVSLSEMKQIEVTVTLTRRQANFVKTIMVDLNKVSEDRTVRLLAGKVWFRIEQAFRKL